MFLDNVSLVCLFPHSFIILAHALEDSVLRLHTKAFQSTTPTPVSVFASDDKIVC